MINLSFAGRIGKTAEVRATQGGEQVTSFSVACNAGKDRTVWVSCAIFGDRGPKLAAYLTKGASVGITGKPSVRGWRANDGENRADLQCAVDQVSLLGSKSDGQQSGPPMGGPSGMDDDPNAIPF